MTVRGRMSADVKTTALHRGQNGAAFRLDRDASSVTMSVALLPTQLRRCFFKFHKSFGMNPNDFAAFFCSAVLATSVRTLCPVVILINLANNCFL